MNSLCFIIYCLMTFLSITDMSILKSFTARHLLDTPFCLLLNVNAAFLDLLVLMYACYRHCAALLIENTNKDMPALLTQY